MQVVYRFILDILHVKPARIPSEILPKIIQSNPRGGNCLLPHKLLDAKQMRKDIGKHMETLRNVRTYHWMKMIENIQVKTCFGPKDV